jgi:hypothetical protein
VRNKYGFRYLDDVLKRDDTHLSWQTVSCQSESEALFKSQMLNIKYEWHIVKYGNTMREWQIIKSNKTPKRKHREFYCKKCDWIQYPWCDDKECRCMDCGEKMDFVKLLDV